MSDNNAINNDTLGCLLFGILFISLCQKNPLYLIFSLVFSILYQNYQTKLQTQVFYIPDQINSENRYSKPDQINSESRYSKPDQINFESRYSIPDQINSESRFSIPVQINSESRYCSILKIFVENSDIFCFFI